MVSCLILLFFLYISVFESKFIPYHDPISAFDGVYEIWSSGCGGL